MTDFFHWLTTLAMLMISAVLIDFVIADAPMKQYVRFAAGMVIVAAFIKPLVSIDWPDFSFISMEQSGQEAIEAAVRAEQERLAGVPSLQAARYAEPVLKKEAEQVVAHFPGCRVSRIEAAIHEGKQDIVITVAGTCPLSDITAAFREQWHTAEASVNIVVKKEERGSG